MNRNNAAFMALTACAALLAYQQGWLAVFLTPDKPAVVVDTTAVAEAKEACPDPADANYLGAVLIGCADVLEHDGTKAAPLFTQRQHLATFQNYAATMWASTKGENKYPKLPAYLAGKMKAFETPGELTSADRTKAAAILREVGAAMQGVR